MVTCQTQQNVLSCFSLPLSLWIFSHSISPSLSIHLFYCVSTYSLLNFCFHLLLSKCIITNACWFNFTPLSPSLSLPLSLSLSISSSYSSNTVSSLAEQHVGSHGNRVYSSSPFDFPCCSTPSCAKWTHYSKQSNNVDIRTKTSTNKQILKG